MKNELPPREELIKLRDQCISILKEIDAIEKRQLARLGVAEILDDFPAVAQALAQGKPFQQTCALFDEAPGPGVHKVLASLKDKVKPKRGRGRPRSRKLLSLEEQNKVFLVYKLNLVKSAEPETHLSRAIQKARNPFVQQFLDETRPMIRFNKSHKEAVRHCSDVFEIGQRHVREIIAAFNRGTVKDELLQAIAEIAEV